MSMSATEEYILREERPVESLVPSLGGSPELSEKQFKFLLHAIRDVDPTTADAKAEVNKRVLEVQRKAYETFPYPCIRAFHHVSLFMSENDIFTEILKIGQDSRQDNAPLLLDIGCCMGTDLRHLAQSGYPATSLIGCDLEKDFIDLGHALYADRDTCQISFFAGDLFDVTSLPFPQIAAEKAGLPLKNVRSLNELRGRIKYIYAGAFFHMFDKGTQEAIARRLATLLDVTEGSGPAVVFGRHAGAEEEGAMQDALGRTRHSHSPESWRKLWERAVGGKDLPVRVDAELRSLYAQRGDVNQGYWLTGVDTDMMFWSVWVG